LLQAVREVEAKALAAQKAEEALAKAAREAEARALPAREAAQALVLATREAETRSRVAREAQEELTRATLEAEAHVQSALEAKEKLARLTQGIEEARDQTARKAREEQAAATSEAKAREHAAKAAKEELARLTAEANEAQAQADRETEKEKQEEELARQVREARERNLAIRRAEQKEIWAAREAEAQAQVDQDAEEERRAAEDSEAGGDEAWIAEEALSQDADGPDPLEGSEPRPQFGLSAQTGESPAPESRPQSRGVLSLLTAWLRKRPRNLPQESEDVASQAADDQAEDLAALEQRIELERTTSLLDPRRKKWRKRHGKDDPGREAPRYPVLGPPIELDNNPALAEAERQAALAHSTSLLSKSQNDRSRLGRNRGEPGLLMPLIVILAIAGVAILMFDSKILPADLQKVDLDSLKDQVAAAVDDAKKAVEDALPSR